MALTGLSDEARKRGLEKARLVRKKRSEVKDRLKKGKISVNALFRDRKLFDEYIAGMKVLSIISSLPGNGKLHAVEVLKKLNINHHKKMGGLGKNQKASFFEYFNITES
ncbi:MAG: 30S ribosomal protein S13 [Actinomycetia bacterium]|nr:30S ribosomal protein S13 [Actinomycetes bacterium]